MPKAMAMGMGFRRQAVHVLTNEIPFTLQDQAAISTVDWPTHAAIFAREGDYPGNIALAIYEAGAPVPAQIEVQNTWPGGSARIIHAYKSFKYTAGQPATYSLVSGVAASSDTTMTVDDTASLITVYNGVLTITIAKPFAGLSSVRFNNVYVINAAAGPYLKDQNDVVHKAVYDDAATVMVEQQGSHQVTIRAEGWLRSVDDVATRFARFVTRFRICLNSPIIFVDHAIVLANVMANFSIKSCRFDFAVNTGSTRKLGLDGTVKTVTGGVTTQRIHQWDYNHARYAEDATVTTGAKADGWAAVQATDTGVAILTKDFWQKFPSQIDLTATQLSYFTWPDQGSDGDRSASDYTAANVYKWLYLHKGAALNQALPTNYQDTLTAAYNSGEATEAMTEYAVASDMQGVALRNEFALYFYDPSAIAEDTVLPQMQALYQQNPIAISNPSEVASSKIFGRASVSNATLANFCADAMRGAYAEIDRYKDYGQFNYGVIHEDEWMNLTRPSLHRVLDNSHFQHISQNWRLFGFSGDADIQTFARAGSDNYRSCSQCNYDNNTTAPGQPGPPYTQWHHEGYFYHDKAYFQWGGSGYGQTNNNDHSGIVQGHWMDPTALLYAWLIDADRWAKDGYQLWYDNIYVPPIPPDPQYKVNEYTGRDFANAFTMLIEAYNNWGHNAVILGHIQNFGASVITKAMPGALTLPVWGGLVHSLYHDLFPNDSAFNAWVLSNAATTFLRNEGSTTIGFFATAYEIAKAAGQVSPTPQSYLTAHYGTLTRAKNALYVDTDGGPWTGIGFGPGADNEGWFGNQYFRYQAALDDEVLTPTDADDSFYWIMPSGTDIRSTEILIKNTAGTIPLVFQTPGIVDMGGANTFEMQCFLYPGSTDVFAADPNADAILGAPYAEPGYRPSSWQVKGTERFTVPSASNGLYRVVLNGQAPGLFSPLQDTQPECQLLKNGSLTGGYTARASYAKRALGYLVARPSIGTATLNFAISDNRSGGHVKITNSLDAVLCDKWFKYSNGTGPDFSIVLDTHGPWHLDAFSDRYGFLKLTIANTGNLDRPFFFGPSLADIAAIAAVYDA